jgi:hypothetical protein
LHNAVGGTEPAALRIKSALSPRSSERRSGRLLDVSDRFHGQVCVAGFFFCGWIETLAVNSLRKSAGIALWSQFCHPELVFATIDEFV